MKQCEENPWAKFAENHKAGDLIEGEIKNITDFGLFIGLEGEIDGLIHHSDISWMEPGEVAIKAFKKGDSVKAKVLAADIEKERISLGIKQLTENPGGAHQEKMEETSKGAVVTCTITEVRDDGLVVKVGDTGQGFIKKIDLARDRQDQRPDRFAVGERVDAKVISTDRSGKVTASIKALEIEEHKKAIAEYGSTDSGASLGDILGAALNQAKEEADKDGKGKKPKKSA
jgi:small subunit ribosomal protein S1